MDSKQVALTEKVELNGKEISKEQLQEKKEQIKNEKGMKIIEVGKDKFKTRIQG